MTIAKKIIATALSAAIIAASAPVTEAVLGKSIISIEAEATNKVITENDISKAISWGKNVNFWTGYNGGSFRNRCLAFIYRCYYRGAGIDIYNGKSYPTAKAYGQEIITNYSSNPPKGAIVFLDTSNPAEHVGISVGDGKFIHTGSNSILISKISDYKLWGWGVPKGYTLENSQSYSNTTTTSKTLTDLPKDGTIYSYTLSAYTERDVYSDSALKNKLRNREIWSSDHCRIVQIVSNDVIKVQYPASGSWRTVYVPSTMFFAGKNIRSISVKYNTSVYRKATGSAKTGTCYTSDEIYAIGNPTNNKQQILYNLDQGGYKLGFISTSAIK